MPYLSALRLLRAVAILAALRGSPSSGATTPQDLTLVDDRGLPIQGEIEVCFQIETRASCSTLHNSARVAIPSGALSVHLEGPEHGPLTLSRAAWEKLGGDTPHVSVPRKARIEVRGTKDPRPTLTLYRQDDTDFRRPTLRLDLPADGVARIPAGTFVASLSTPGRAPALHLLDAAPGSSRRLAYRPETGWSQLFRCRSARDGALVEGASVSLLGTEGFTPKGAPGRDGKTNRRGLVVFTGLAYPLASARVGHPAFVQEREEGLSASPGTFGFREVTLETGATLRAKVSLEGRPKAGVRCQVLAIDANPIGPAGEPEVRSETVTGREGLCRSAKLAAGPYTLRLRMPEGRSFADRSFELAAGEETALDISLEAIRVHGKVVRGSQPAAAYEVLLSDQNELKPNATARDAQAEATTDDEGEYEAVLWSAGDYFAVLETSAGTPAAHKRVRLEAGDERVDFFLSEHGIGGTVLDERERPVKDASVLLRWHGAVRQARTDPQGTFLFPVSEEGTGELAAMKAGYVAPEPTPVTVGADAPLPPQILHLRRAGLLTGKVVARGPVAGASLLGYRVGPNGVAQFLGAATTDADGAFELAAAEAATTRIYVTGPGCPLTPFTVQLPADDLTLQCSDLPASAEVRFTDTQGKPIPGKTVLARKDGVIIPAEVLARHLAGLHLHAATDGGGRLLLVALAPGSYDLFLAEATSPELVATGSSSGFLTSATLAPLGTSELEVTLDARP